jgi:aldose 1-epimerase
MEMEDLKTNVTEHNFDGMNAVTLKAGKYSAMVLPEFGGNLISFRDEEQNYSFLRTPPDVAALTRKPVLYGMPVLFPPNRYEDGTFTIHDRTYQFPINEEATHTHIHGFLKDIPWDVSATGTTTDTAYVELSKQVDSNGDIFRYFPHEFAIRIRYTLMTEGLHQDVTIQNNGSEAMPLMLGFHTSLHVPFALGSKPEDYTLHVTVGQRWELSERMLPTGHFQALTSEEEQLRDGGVYPFYGVLDNHYTAMPQGGKNYAALTDNRLGVRLIYEVDEQYRQWMVFNNFSRGEFVCPEPQTSMVNAPNVDLPNSTTGLVMLQPASVWQATNRLYVETL